MPRAKKPQALVAPHNTGSPMQAPAAPTGLPYGMHQDSIESQQQMPLPAVPELDLPAGPPVDPMQSALAMAPPTNMLTAPTDRPNEPITHGLPVGPGAGPEILPPAQPNVSSALMALYDATGDESFKRLADQNRAQGR